jgi:hypothetical protein
MPPKEKQSPEELLKDPKGDIAELRKLGITEYAIITYIVRVREGQPKEKALRALLQGRKLLTEEQKQFVRFAISRLPVGDS